MIPFMMGPLSKVWSKLENFKKFDAHSFSLDKVLSLVERTICSFRQTSNSILYDQRYNILSSLCCPQEAKKMLKNQVESDASPLSLDKSCKTNHLFTWSNK